MNLARLVWTYCPCNGATCFLFFAPSSETLFLFASVQKKVQTLSAREFSKQSIRERAQQLSFLFSGTPSQVMEQGMQSQFGMLWYNPARPAAPLIKERDGIARHVSSQTDRWAYGLQEWLTQSLFSAVCPLLCGSHDSALTNSSGCCCLQFVFVSVLKNGSPRICWVVWVGHTETPESKCM